MAFSENVKLEVKKKSAFQCCRCHEIGIDVHHILPQADKGPDTVDNAAPLCQNCHDRFGANSEKRKEIRQMRDWWYEVVREKYSGKDDYLKKLEQLDANISHYNKQNAELLNKIATDIQGLMTTNTPQRTDDKEVVKKKITRSISLGPSLYRKNYYCPFCSKDLTLELMQEVPHLLEDYNSPISRMLTGSIFLDTSPFRETKETLVECPYCHKHFNLKNVNSTYGI
jgi:hypothetical protein